CTGGEMNRAAHFAGGRLEARLAGLGDRYSVSLWFWNGMPAEARAMAGWLISRGSVHGLGQGDHLGIGGTAAAPGRLVFARGDQADDGPMQSGRTEIKRWTWNHAILVRDGASVRVYLNGNAQPEIEMTAEAGSSGASDRLFLGGRCDNHLNWEGRLDEIAVFDRALTAEEIAPLADPWTRSRVAGASVHGKRTM
ncbi:MAG TPA: LamG domain-containing protein, partial [Candidatus Paceibacterota bacterium]|nr:LamG domain-containing protein [Candidatus Paceibacterota bacterium]